MKVLTILGRGPSWKDCIFQTEELWGTVSNLAVPELGDKKYNKLFAFDGLEDVELKHCVDLAKERNIPIISTREYGTEKYPLIDIARKYHTSYLNNSVSYMIAYALFQDYKKIYLHGIDQGPQWNYQDGKPYITFWLGMANMAMVDIRLGPGSLKWQYKSGLENLPEAFIEEQKCEICHYVVEEDKDHERIFRNLEKVRMLFA